MKRKTRIPGFLAEVVVEQIQPKTYIGSMAKRSTSQSIVPQSEFSCGLSIAAFVGGLALGNPGLAFGGLKFMLSDC